MTPRMRGFLLRGRIVLLRVTVGWRCDSRLLSGVNKVTVDLVGLRARPRSSAHATTRLAWSERALAAVVTSGLKEESVKSSA